MAMLLSRMSVLSAIEHLKGTDVYTSIEEMPYFEIDIHGKPAFVDCVLPANDFSIKGNPDPRCTEFVEGDELRCHCGLRWDAKEDRPPCPHGR